MKTYVIRPGDYLTAIAAREGLAVKDIWNDPANKDLVELRKHYNVLKAGDVLHLPDRATAPAQFTAGATNSYTAAPAPVTLRVVFTHRGKALANLDYEVHGAGPVATGTTDGRGKGEVKVTTVVASVDVKFPSVKVAFHLKVGHLDPADDPGGALQRLAHLGYTLGEPRGELGAAYRGRSSSDPLADRLGAALRAFQRDQGLEETGELDAATADKLRAAHGS